MPRLEWPSATSASTSRSRAVSSSSGSRRRRPPEQPGDDRGVDHGLAVGDAAQRVDQDGDVEDALLEQVADALGVVLEQAHRVARLDVLGQHAARRCRGAPRGSAARRRAPRRCASAACGCRRSRRRAGARRPAAAARRRPRPAPTPRRRRRSSRRTMPSRVSMTSSATTTRMGSRAWTSDGRASTRPPSAPTRSATGSEQRRRGRSVVAHLDHERVPSARATTHGGVARAAARGVLHGLDDGDVGGALDGGRVAPLGEVADLDRQRGAARRASTAPAPRPASASIVG